MSEKPYKPIKSSKTVGIVSGDNLKESYGLEAAKVK